MNIKQSFKEFKEKFPLLFIINGILLSLIILILVLIRKKIDVLMAVMQQYGPQIQEIQKQAQSEVLNSNSYMAINNLEALTGNTINFLFYIAPIAFLILFLISQSITWYYIKGKEAGKFKYFFIKFLIPTIVASILSLLTFLSVADQTKISVNNFFKHLMIIFIIFYFLYTFYLSIKNIKTKELMHRYFTVSIKKFYLFIPLLLPLFILFSMLIFLMWTLFISITIKQYFLFSPIMLILYMVVIISFSLWYKLYLNLISKEY